MIAVGIATHSDERLRARTGPAGSERAGRRRRADPLRGSAGLQLRLRGDDRGRGDLGRRAGLQAAGMEERAHDADRDDLDPGRDLRRHHLPGAPVRDLPDGSQPDQGYETVVSQIARHTFGGDNRGLLLHPVRDDGDPGPRPRTPPTPTSRACPTSWPATASCRASSPSAATGWPSPPASSRWDCSPASVLAIYGGEVEGLIPLYAVGVFTSFTISQFAHVHALAEAPRAGLESGPDHQPHRGDAQPRSSPSSSRSASSGPAPGSPRS